MGLVLGPTYFIFRTFVSVSLCFQLNVLKERKKERKKEVFVKNKFSYNQTQL